MILLLTKKLFKTVRLGSIFNYGFYVVYLVEVLICLPEYKQLSKQAGFSKIKNIYSQQLLQATK